MLTLYNVALVPARLAAEAWSLWVSRRPDGRIESAERLARRLPEVGPGGLWLHGASVGEARVLTRLVHAIRSSQAWGPIAASAVTRTGRSQLPSAPDVDAAFFAPLDFRGTTGRVFDALRPAALGLVETEIWPNLLAGAERRGIPVVILNGRLAPEKMRRYERFAGLFGPLLREVACVGAQSDADAERFGALGVPRARIEVTGNVKYDLDPPVIDPAELRRTYGIAADRPVFVAGSTAEGEEAAVLDAFDRARTDAPRLLLVLAPRRPERADVVERLCHARHHRCVRVSDASPVVTDATDVLLVDTVGRLTALYALADLAFVGGSLVPVGGHNVLEPAAVGIPVLFGPHTEHVAEPAERLVASGGGIRVDDAAGLVEAVPRLLAHAELRASAGRAARGVVEANRGAVGRSVELLRGVLGRVPASRGIA